MTTLEEKGLTLVAVAKGDHVGIAERAIRLIKERARCIIAELPYSMQKSFAKYLVYYTCNRINALPRITSGSACSPRELFRGIKLDYQKDLCLSFGQYVQAYRAPVQSNSLEARTSGAIALYPKENHSRSWVFLDINTGYVFTSTKWHALPLSDIIIDYLNQFDNMISAQRSRKDERPPP